MAGTKAPCFTFPVVTFRERSSGLFYAYINQYGKALFDGFDSVDILKTPEHIIFATVGRVGAGAFKIRHKDNGEIAICSHTFFAYPIIGKTFRLYRCTHGCAIRLHEPIFDRRNENGKSI